MWTLVHEVPIKVAAVNELGAGVAADVQWPVPASPTTAPVLGAAVAAAADEDGPRAPLSWTYDATAPQPLGETVVGFDVLRIMHVRDGSDTVGVKEEEDEHDDEAKGDDAGDDMSSEWPGLKILQVDVKPGAASHELKLDLAPFCHYTFRYVSSWRLAHGGMADTCYAE